MAEQTKGGYGKRPLWHWIVLYIIVGLIVYFLVYYFVLARKAGGINYGGQNYQQSSSQGY